MCLWPKMLWNLGVRHIRFSPFFWIYLHIGHELVRSVGPRSAFAKFHLAHFHKIWSMVFVFWLSCGRWLVLDEIELRWNNLLVFWFPLKKNLINIIHHVPSPSQRMTVNCPTCLCLQLSFWLFSHWRIRSLFYKISDNVMAMRGLTMPQNGRT